MSYEAKRLIEIRQGVLSKNDQLAAELRRRFHAAGTFVVNLLSSPGAGKTSLLEATMRALLTEYRVAALVGDLATDNDAPPVGAQWWLGPPDSNRRYVPS